MDELEESVGHFLDVALTPVRVAISKPARKVYISTILFFGASLLLLGVSVVAYLLFYLRYIPQLSFESVVHLEFGDGHPRAVVTLPPVLISRQAYDVSVQLRLPRTNSNLAAGNFMLDLSLIAPPSSGGPLTPSSALQILAHSRRPAIMKYASPVVETASNLASLPWYMLGWKQEADELSISMMEGLEFQRGWRNIPAALKLEIQADKKLQVYETVVRFVARFTGLRWIMYRHRIVSFLLFTSLFWATSMLFLCISWLLFSTIRSGRRSPKDGVIDEDGAAGKPSFGIKSEAEESDEPDLSDTSRTFPTFSRQPPLRYVSSKVKSESSEEAFENTPKLEPLGAEADDEDGEDDLLVPGFTGRGTGRGDSGLGTSLEESQGREGLQRRRSRGGSGR